jgi:hypothetical protein
MAVSSLNKFTVPLSSEQGTSQGLLMPKLAYRFRVTFDNFGVAGAPSTEMTKQVVKCGRPKVTFDDIILNVYNSKVKLAGKPTWDELSITIRDDVSSSASILVGNQLQKQFDFFEQSSAASGIDYKFSMTVDILDGGNGAFTPTTFESFQLLGCYIKKADYKDVDYGATGDSTPLEITLTIQYDNALQYGAGGAPSGVGQAIGRTVRTLAVGG